MTKREQFLIYMMGFAGLPYIWGGSNPRHGLDCSGLVQILLAWFKLDPPGDQTADALMHHFAKPENGYRIGAFDAQLGDLVFYGGSKATHVVMCLDGTLMFEAGGGGSSTTTPEKARKQGASVRVANIKRRADILCVLRPRGISW